MYIYIYISVHIVYLGSKSLCKLIWLNTADCFFLKSSSEDVRVFLLVFLCLDQFDNIFGLSYDYSEECHFRLFENCRVS